MNKYKLTQSEVDEYIVRMIKIAKELGLYRIYGIPRGGSQVAIEMTCADWGLLLVTDPEPYGPGQILIVDDIVETGSTVSYYLQNEYHVASMLRKGDISDYRLRVAQDVPDGVWIQFPWEPDTDGESLVTRMLEYIGEDPTREGLVETPKRVLKAWNHWFSGYDKNPKDIMKIFNDDTSDEIVLLKDIEMYSFCEHHLAPFVGKAHIAYIPNGKILGASKLARLLDVYARRLQIQERIAQQVVSALEEHLQPKGAACYIEAKHLCISSRGVEKQGSVFITSALTGCFKENPAARAEFLSMIQ